MHTLVGLAPYGGSRMSAKDVESVLLSAQALGTSVKPASSNPKEKRVAYDEDE